MWTHCFWEKRNFTCTPPPHLCKCFQVVFFDYHKLAIGKLTFTRIQTVFRKNPLGNIDEMRVWVRRELVRWAISECHVSLTADVDKKAAWWLQMRTKNKCGEQQGFEEKPTKSWLADSSFLFFHNPWYEALALALVSSSSSGQLRSRLPRVVVQQKRMASLPQSMDE